MTEPPTKAAKEPSHGDRVSEFWGFLGLKFRALEFGGFRGLGFRAWGFSVSAVRVLGAVERVV